MLRMSVIVLIGILFASGDEDIQSIEAISDIANKTNLGDSRIVVIKIKPDFPVKTRRSESVDNDVSKTADDQELIYVDVKTDITKDSNTSNDPIVTSTEINVKTRRFSTNNGTDNEQNTPEVKEESRTSDQETSTIDVVERTGENNPTENNPTANNPTVNNPTANNPTANNPTANNPTENNPTDNNPTDNNPTEKNPSQKISTTDSIGRAADKKPTEPNLNAESKSATGIEEDTDSDSFLNSEQSSEEISAAPTRRSQHYNSSVLSNVETKKETPDNSEHKVEIVRQGSGVIEEDIETVESIPSENTRRRFDNDFEYYPELMFIDDDDRIQSAKSRVNAHDVLLDTRARSGIPHDDFDVPVHTYYYSEPYNNYQNYDAKGIDYQSHNTKTALEYQPQNIPIASYQPYTNKPIADYQSQNIPIANYQPYKNKHIADYQSQNIPLTIYQPNNIETIGGYQPHDILPTAGLSYNTRPPFDYQSDPLFTNIKTNIWPQPQSISQPYNTIPITGYQPYSNKPIADYSHNTNPFTGYQPKSTPIVNYLPLYDNTNTFADYKPTSTPMPVYQPFKQNLDYYQPHGINTIAVHRPQIMPTSDHQVYTYKPAVNYKPFDEKFISGNPPNHIINPNVGYQSPNIADYQPFYTKHTIDVQSYDTKPQHGYLPNYNIKPNIGYQSPNKPIAGYQPYNTRPDYQQYNINPSTGAPFVVNQRYDSKPIFDNRILEIPLAGYTQDTSHLGPLHQSNQLNFHPVYGNRQHYMPQNLQPIPSSINTNPKQLGSNLELAQKPCKYGNRCNLLGNLGPFGNTMHSNNANRNIVRAGINDGLDLNANIGHYRTAYPYNRNVKVLNRINPYQYSGHFINVRSVDSNRSTETNVTSSEDDLDYDEYDSKNNYPLFTRHSEKKEHKNIFQLERSNNYSHERSNNYPHESQSLDSTTYESRDSNNKFDESKDLVSVLTPRLNNNPMEPKNVSPYEPRHLNNSPNESRVPNINLYDPQGSNPYDFRGTSPYEPKHTNINPYEPRGSNSNHPYNHRGPIPFELQGSNYNPLEPQDSNKKLFESRSLNNSPRGYYNNAFELKDLVNPYEPQIGLLSDPYMPPPPLSKRYYIGG